MTDKAVVLMYYGFPEREEEMVEYLKDILHGKTPPDGLVRENIQKLRMIGGASPSGRIVTSIRKKVEEKLHDHGYRVYLLSKHYKPSLKDAGKIVDGEVVFEIPLFPIYSDFIFRSYFEVLEDRLQGRQFIRIFNIGFEEPLLSYYRGMVRGDEDYLLVFSAHSIPLEYPDEYPVNVERLSSLLSAGREYVNIYHSQGPFHEKWLGPYPEYSIKYAKEKGMKGIKVVPIGFIYDHIEVLYDLDEKLRGEALEYGLDYVRVPLPNDSEPVIDSIVNLILRMDRDR